MKKITLTIDPQVDPTNAATIEELDRILTQIKEFAPTLAGTLNVMQSRVFADLQRREGDSYPEDLNNFELLGSSLGRLIQSMPGLKIETGETP